MYRQLFWPVLAPSVLIGAAAGATAPVSVIAAIHLGASPAFASLIVAMVGLTQLSTTVLAGRLIDVVGDRRAMVLATAAVAATTVLTVSALVWGGRGALALFVGAALLRAPVVSTWSLARQALVAETVPVEWRGRAMTALGGTMRAGNLVGPLAGAALLVRFDLWSVYVLSLAFALLSLALLFTPAGSALDRARAAQEAKDPGAAEAASGPLDVRWTPVVLAGVSIATLAVARVAGPVGVQLWGVHLGIHPSTISLLVALGALVELGMMFPGGYLKDRLGRAPILVACLAIYAGGFALMPMLPHLPGMAAGVLVMALGNGLGAGINMTIGADLSPSVGRGRFLGIWALFSNVGALAGPATMSGLVALAGIRAGVLGVAGIALAGAVWMAVCARAAGLPAGVGASQQASGDRGAR